MIGDCLGLAVVIGAAAVAVLCLMYVRRNRGRNRSRVRLFTLTGALLVVVSNALELAHVVTMAAGVGYIQRAAILILLMALAVEVWADL